MSRNVGRGFFIHPYRKEIPESNPVRTSFYLWPAPVSPARAPFEATEHMTKPNNEKKRSIQKHKYLTTGQAARILDVSPGTISKMCDLGKLKFFRIPGSKDRRIEKLHFCRVLEENGWFAEAEELLGPARILLVGGDDRLEIAIDALGSRCFRRRCLFDAGRVVEANRIGVIIWDGCMPLSQIQELIAQIETERPYIKHAVILYEDQNDIPGPHVVFRYPFDPDEAARCIVSMIEVRT
jgi:excisionase family DNA binding protein